MCGITGIYNFKKDGEVRENDLVAMRDTLAHRGPDGAGVFVSPDRRVGLGHRRLAIIDLTEAGAQPMGRELRIKNKELRGTTTAELWITYNGEVYDFRELRDELEKKGHTFKSRTDTEVILAAYAEYGFSCVKRFNGMFAFAIWDEEKKLLFAARDHLGIKPFYYAFQNGAFYFGSEIKAILKHPDFKKELAEEHITYYLTFSSMPAPETLFRDVQKLPAAHCMTVEADGLSRIWEYWNPIKENEYAGREADENFYIRETRRLLEDSIRGQMVSDVPFGCFLSGGIDSSTNAALMSRALGKPVETFSIGVEDYQKYNEFRYSREIAGRLGARTHEKIVGRKDLLEFLPEYGFYADDPNGDQICFLVFYLARLTREAGVIVAQVGEGSDEIFAGYETYRRALNLHERIWKHVERLPGFLRRAPFALGRAFFSDPRHDFKNGYLDRLARGREPYWGNAIAFSDYQKEKLLTADYQRQVAELPAYRFIAEQYKAARAADAQADFLKQMTYLELKVRLSELLLMRVDKMAMANSIEARVPFLDRRLVELALSIPPEIKFKNGTPKHILKQAVRGVIPDAIIDRKKQGFGAPLAEWLRDKEGNRAFTDIIFKSRLRDRNILNYEYVQKLIAAHQTGRADHNFRIWNLISLSLWHDYWF